MNNGLVLFFGILASLAASFWTLIFAPQLQLGRLDTRIVDASSPAYPPLRPGQAQQGAEVFRAHGCAECHTRQVRQTGAEFDVYLTDAGSNRTELAQKLIQFDKRFNQETLARLFTTTPVRVATGLTATAAQKLAGPLTNGGATATPVLVPLGPDIARGWGRRLSVAQDYLNDHPVQLGSLRLGPDLANYGARQTNATLILAHLYEPRRTVPGSMMPPYPFLFEKRPLSAGEAKPTDAILVQGEGVQRTAIVPRESARALAAYLISLKAEADLFEGPVPKVPAASAPATNAVAAAPAP